MATQYQIYARSYVSIAAGDLEGIELMPREQASLFSTGGPLSFEAALSVVRHLKETMVNHSADIFIVPAPESGRAFEPTYLGGNYDVATRKWVY